MKLYVKRMPELQLPKKANNDQSDYPDAAYDILATTPPKIVGKQLIIPYDLRTAWSRVDYIEYGTNLFVAPEVQEINTDLTDGGQDRPSTFIHYHTLLYPRSSISKYQLILANSVGTIDAGYRGQIFVKFKYYFQPEDLVSIAESGGTKIYGIVNPDTIYNQGDKIVQIKPEQNTRIDFELVDMLPNSTRGSGGFGSSGI